MLVWSYGDPFDVSGVPPEAFVVEELGLAEPVLRLGGSIDLGVVEAAGRGRSPRRLGAL
jgi:hypothetical protein